MYVLPDDKNKAMVIAMDEDKSLNDYAALVATRLNEKEKIPHAFCFNPGTLVIIAKLIVDVVKLIVECKKLQSNRLVTIKSPTIFEQIRLGRLVNKYFTENRSAIRQAILDTGRKITAKDLDNLIKAL